MLLIGLSCRKFLRPLRTVYHRSKPARDEYVAVGLKSSIEKVNSKTGQPKTVRQRGNVRVDVKRTASAYHVTRARTCR